MHSPARTLFQSRLFSLGEFRCFPEDVRWRAVNVMSGAAHVVFPGTSVVIHQQGHKPVLTNQNHVMFYDRGRRYRRVLHDPRGDHCAYVGISPELAGELLAQTPVAAKLEHALPFIQGPSDPRAYVSLYVALRALRRRPCDSLAIEEIVFHALARSIEVAAALHFGCRGVRRPRTDEEHHRLVEDAKAFLTARATDSDSLESVAHALHISAFHLSRIFRERTGFTVHRYRTQIRLRLALDYLADGQLDLPEIATELGFCNHSHFTSSFREAFGLPPSEARRTVTQPRLREWRRLIDAPVGVTNAVR